MRKVNQIIGLRPPFSKHEENRQFFKVLFETAGYLHYKLALIQP